MSLSPSAPVNPCAPFAAFPTAERVRVQGNYTEYLREFLGGAGGSQDELLAFS